jgi:hypothetical protein
MKHFLWKFTLVIAIIAIIIILYNKNNFMASFQKPVGIYKLLDAKDIKPGMRVQGDLYAILDFYVEEETKNSTRSGFVLTHQISGRYYVFPVGKKEYMTFVASPGQFKKLDAIVKSTKNYIAGNTTKLGGKKFHFDGIIKQLQPDAVTYFNKWFKEFQKSSDPSTVTKYALPLKVSDIPFERIRKTVYISATVLAVDLVVLAISIIVIAKSGDHEKADLEYTMDYYNQMGYGDAPDYGRSGQYNNADSYNNTMPYNPNVFNNTAALNNNAALNNTAAFNNTRPINTPAMNGNTRPLNNNAAFNNTRPINNPAFNNTRPMNNNPAFNSTRPMNNNPAYNNTRPVNNNPAFGNTRQMNNNPAYNNTRPINNNPAFNNSRPINNNPAYNNTRPINNNPAFHNTRPINNNPAFHNTRPLNMNAAYGNPNNSNSAPNDDMYMNNAMQLNQTLKTKKHGKRKEKSTKEMEDDDFEKYAGSMQYYKQTYLNGHDSDLRN